MIVSLLTVAALCAVAAGSAALYLLPVLIGWARRVPDLGAIDARIRPLFERMLQPDPKDRPQMAEIESWTIGTPKPVPPKRSNTAMKRRRPQRA